jgi:8-oxo-dGTP pyrophosphatase MutT (NUDIX family)
MLPRGVRYQAAIIEEHRVLLLRVFLREDGREIWIFPGGGREPGESEAECLRRELREETHLENVARTFSSPNSSRAVPAESQCSAANARPRSPAKAPASST